MATPYARYLALLQQQKEKTGEANAKENIGNGSQTNNGIIQ